MNISLTKPLEAFVQEQLSTGLYGSASEVIRAGLRLLREHEIDIDGKIATSLKQIEDGNYSEANDEFWNRLKSRVEKRITAYPSS